MTLEDLHVERIKAGDGIDYIRRRHYSRSCHNGPLCWGLFSAHGLVGVVAYATPAAETVRAVPFGAEYVDRVTELHRLFTVDGLPKNATSWFVSRSIEGLLEAKPELRAIISYSDMTEGHVGYIYQALNFVFTGSTTPRTFYRDEEGRLRHPRQCGENITRKQARELGWIAEKRDSKNRYVLVIGHNKRQRKRWKRKLQIDSLPYPKE